MNLFWSSTFTTALGKLTSQEQATLTATNQLFDSKGNPQAHTITAVCPAGRGAGWR